MFLKKEASKQGKSRDFVTLNKMPSLRRAEWPKKSRNTLISYLANNAYYVSIDSKYYNQGAASKILGALVPIESKFKIDPMITNGNIPGLRFRFSFG
jgi:hypothetical protein